MKKKTEMKFFTIMDHEKEQAYLRSMHNHGWKFLNVTGLGSYHFEECTPEDVIYQLDYNQEGIAHKDEYVQMFADCGWEYIQDFVGYSYFRKSAALGQGDAEIFCDDESRLQMMERVYKGRLLPLVIFFSCVLIPQFLLNLLLYHNYGVAAFCGAVIALYLTLFGGFAVKYGNYKKQVRK